MKKTLLTICFAMAAVCGMAQTQTIYNEKIVVDIDGQSTDSIPAVINVTTNADGTCDFTLKNFHLIQDESDIAVGNISVKGVKMTADGKVTAISTNQTIKIENGDDESVAYWLGPDLGDVPVVLSGIFCADHLYASLDIDMAELLGQSIKVAVGNKEVTAVTTVKANAGTTAAAAYTLSGVRVNKAQAKGLYIVGGKKVIK